MLAIIFGIFGIKQTRNPNVRGRGLAVAGIIIGVLNMIIGGVIFSLFGLGLFLGVGVYKTTHNAAVQVVKDVSNGNTQAAAAMTDASNISAADLDTLHQKMQAWGTFKDVTLTPKNIQADMSSGDAEYVGTAVFTNSTQPCVVHLKRFGKDWKVTSITIGTGP